MRLSFCLVCVVCYLSCHFVGIQEWVDQGIGPGNDAELFYTNPTLRSAYKDWIKHLITRNNTLTGQRYIDDPTILAWELLNEPRAADNYEKNQGLVPGKMVCDWVWDVAAYIK